MQRANLSSIRQHSKHCQSESLHCAVLHFKYCQLAVLQIGAAGLHSWLLRYIWVSSKLGTSRSKQSASLENESQLCDSSVVGGSHGMLMLYNFVIDVAFCTYVQRVCRRRREGWERFQSSRRVETPLGKAIRNSSGAPY